MIAKEAIMLYTHSILLWNKTKKQNQLILQGTRQVWQMLPIGQNAVISYWLKNAGLDIKDKNEQLLYVCKAREPTGNKMILRVIKLNII